MITATRIKANEFVADFRAGAADLELLEKYNLSQEKLDSVLKKLVSAGALREPEVLERSKSPEEPTNGRRTRELPREYLPFWLGIQDVQNPGVKAVVRDITEKGFRVAGIRAKVNEIKHFLILADVFRSLKPILVEATCRWSDTRGKKKAYHTSGFEITEISREDLKELSDLVEFIELINSGIHPRRLGLNSELFEKSNRN
jgi:hypothetical protein